MDYINNVALYNESEGTVNVVVEICPGTRDKSELIDPGFSSLKCVRQVEKEYPFYYGSFPKTYAGDKDPLDMIMFTDIKHNQLDIVAVDVIGAIRTVDAGEQDDKIICVESDSNLVNVKKQFKEAMKFLKEYKGKNADMVIDKHIVGRLGAEKLVDEAHESWKKYRNTPKTRSIRVKLIPKE